MSTVKVNPNELLGAGRTPDLDRGTRVNFNVTPNTAKELKRISNESKLSMTEIFRLALGIFRIAWDESRKGNKLALVNQDGKVLGEILIPH